MSQDFYDNYFSIVNYEEKITLFVNLIYLWDCTGYESFFLTRLKNQISISTRKLNI